MPMDLLRFATAGSVDDGKSTLIGRLLYDSKSLFSDQLDAVERVDADRVGNKMANLADVRVAAGLAAPDGFCITTVACRHFVQVSGLAQLIDEHLALAQTDDLEAAGRVFDAAARGLDPQCADVELGSQSRVSRR